MLAAGGRRPDWIVARSFDGVACALAARILRLNTRIALHNHGWEEYVHEVERRLPHSAVTSPTTWKARAVRFPLLRLCLALCDRCVCGTVAEMRWLARRYPRRRRKLAFVPNGVALRESCVWGGAIECPPAFLIVGPPTWKKNAEYACAVFAAISERSADARLFWIGSDCALPPPAAHCIRRRGAVTHVPHEAPENMPRWYAACPFLISASRFEGGHSLAVLEAMSFGVVVFASPIPSTLEIVRHSDSGPGPVYGRCLAAAVSKHGKVGGDRCGIGGQGLQSRGLAPRGELAEVGSVTPFGVVGYRIGYVVFRACDQGKASAVCLCESCIHSRFLPSN
jgi:glycosyltransferase involved in cell wall biosynthesis